MKKLKFYNRLFAMLVLFLFARAGVSQCMPAFTYTVNSSGQVVFMNTSVGSSTTSVSSWVCPPYPTYTTSGTVSNATTSITFTASGTYTMTMFLWDAANSCTSSASQTFAVVVPCTLAPAFTISVGSSGSVTLTNLSTGTTSSTTYTVGWGDTGFSSTYTWQYTATGVYNVTLTAHSGTCNSSVVHTVSIPSVCNLAPTFSLTPLSNGLVSYTNTTSTGTTASTSYTLNWGDGTINGPNPHQYTANATYVATLTASNSTFCTSSFTQQVSVNNFCNLNANFTLTPSGSNVVLFTNLSTGTNSSVTYTLYWGDGSSVFSPSNVSTYSHTYTLSGVYSVTLFAVTNFPACNSTTSHTFSVIVPCTLAPTFSLTLLPNGQVSYTNTTSSGTTASTTYTMNWGDGTINGPNPHQYTANATYTPTLSASNSTSCAGSFTQQIFVNNICSLNANFSLTPSGNNGVLFTNLSTGTNSSVTYTLEWGDGTSVFSPSNVSTYSHTYTLSGVYSVTLIAMTNFPACTSTLVLSTTVTPTVAPCDASFSYSLGANGNVSFSSTASSTASILFSWNFGDTNTGNGPQVTHTYSNNSTYSASLTAQNLLTPSMVCTTSQVFTVSSVPIITCTPVEAAFSHTVTSGGVITCVGTGSESGTCSWDFGDGYLGIGTMVTHAYSASGEYYLTLIVNNGSCSDTLTQAINITGPPCAANANFSITPTSTAQWWNATPAYPWNVSSATWHWGDGSNSNGLYTSHTYSAAGNYSICLTVFLSCGDSATYCAPYYLSRSEAANSIIHINVTPPQSIFTSIATTAASDADYSIYPNPTNGSFSIQLNGMTGSRIKLSVYNLLGEQVYESDNETTNGSLIKDIDLDTANGVYFIKVSSGNKAFLKKLIINK